MDEVVVLSIPQIIVTFVAAMGIPSALTSYMLSRHEKRLEKQSIQDFKELIKDLEICRVNVQDTANKANIDKLYERMRYENPVSSPKAIEENLRIKGLIAELADITDNTLFEAKCNEIVKQLDIRKIKNTKEQ